MKWWKPRTERLDVQADASAARDELLSAYLDGALDPVEARALAASIEADAELRDALAGMREVRSGLAALGEVRAPRSFALAAPPAPAARSFGRFELGARIGAAVAAFAFVVVVGGDLLSGASETTGTRDFASTAANSERASEESLAAAGQAGDSSSGGAAGAPPATAVRGLPTSVSEPAPPRDAGTPTALLVPQTGAGSGTGAQPSIPVVTPPTTTERFAEPDADGVDGAAPDVTSDQPAEDLPAVSPAVPGGLGGFGGLGGDLARPGVATLQPALGAPMQGAEWRISVEHENRVDVLRAAEAGFGGVAVALGAVAVWLWYQRRRSVGAS